MSKILYVRSLIHSQWFEYGATNCLTIQGHRAHIAETRGHTHALMVSTVVCKTLPPSAQSQITLRRRAAETESVPGGEQVRGD